MSGSEINIMRTLGLANDTYDEEVLHRNERMRYHYYNKKTDKWMLNKAGRNYIKQEVGGKVNTAYIVLCVAAAGQGQFRMEKAFNNYEKKSEAYKTVNKYSQEAASKQQGAADSGGCTTMSDGLVAYCKKNNVGFSKKGNDYNHNKDEWQSLRDGLDYEKSKKSTDMKMAASKFDQASKDCDSAQQMAVDGVKKNTDILSKVSNMR